MLLFLDFDGVLHPVSGEPFQCLPRLEALLRDNPRIDVVLSTSWRLLHSLDELRAFFTQDLQRRIIGQTPVIMQIEMPYRPYVRHREIREYLRRHTKLAKRRYLILDDDVTSFPPDCPYLILCDPNRGFDELIEATVRNHIAELG